MPVQTEIGESASKRRIREGEPGSIVSHDVGIIEFRSWRNMFVYGTVSLIQSRWKNDTAKREYVELLIKNYYGDVLK